MTRREITKSLLRSMQFPLSPFLGGKPGNSISRGFQLVLRKITKSLNCLLSAIQFCNPRYRSYFYFCRHLFTNNLCAFLALFQSLASRSLYFFLHVLGVLHESGLHRLQNRRGWCFDVVLRGTDRGTDGCLAKGFGNTCESLSSASKGNSFHEFGLHILTMHRRCWHLDGTHGCLANGFGDVCQGFSRSCRTIRTRFHEFGLHGLEDWGG
mmetsp:Transcript_14578/g.33762  ORF Transcript_14578/g.33762 Transcript_14578/m.33762 type:complete len:210 (+) Transcript_14578:358-987(+)